MALPAAVVVVRSPPTVPASATPGIRVRLPESRPPTATDYPQWGPGARRLPGSPAVRSRCRGVSSRRGAGRKKQVVQNGRVRGHLSGN